MRLHGYFRSSAAYRVRIALALKGIEVENVPVNLLRGEQQGEEFRRLNSQGLVPVLQAAEGTITQSLAIIEWLEETHPLPALLPRDPYLRGQGAELCLGHRLRRPSASQSAGDEEAAHGFRRR
jgi:Glutathione S-transferase